MRLRSKAREVTLHLLYQIEMSHKEYTQAYQEYRESFPVQEEVLAFAFMLFEGVVTHKVKIDPFIKKYVKNWEIERMAVIDRNILRLACFELLYVEEIPPKVSINEAIELAKRFGDIDSPRFVNGVLDKLYKSERKDKEVLPPVPDGET